MDLLVNLLAALVFLVLVLLVSGLCSCLWVLRWFCFSVWLVLHVTVWRAHFCLWVFGLVWLCHFGFCLGVLWCVLGFMVVWFGFACGGLWLLWLLCFAVLLCGSLLRVLSAMCWWLVPIVAMFVTRLGFGFGWGDWFGLLVCLCAL